MKSLIRAVWHLVSPPIPANELKMRSKMPHRVLVFARNLIEDRRRWTTGVEARMASGIECTPDSPDAVCFCANGALRACSADPAALMAATARLASVIDEPAPTAYIAVAHQNDGRGHRAVLAAFDKAIAECGR
jgi:hypothetical protein